jgi:hypothetical protein
MQQGGVVLVVGCLLVRAWKMEEEEEEGRLGSEWVCIEVMGQEVVMMVME